MPISVNEQTCSSAGASEYTNMQRRYLGVKWSQVQNTVSPTQVRVYFFSRAQCGFSALYPNAVPQSGFSDRRVANDCGRTLMRYNLLQVAHADEA
jgi:hypothetical protein